MKKTMDSMDRALAGQKQQIKLTKNLTKNPTLQEAERLNLPLKGSSCYFFLKSYSHLFAPVLDSRSQYFNFF